MGKFQLLFQVDKLMINIAGACISLVRTPKLLKYRKLLEKNKTLKENRVSDKCYICGLGPSLKSVNLNELDGDTIVVNRFNRFDKEKNFSPTYYCITDSGFLSQENQKELIEATSYYKNTKYFLNAAFFDFINDKSDNSENLYYSCNWKGSFSHKNEIDYAKNESVMENVVCYAISLALYMGYKEIILLGCDYNTFATQKPIHCYGEEDSRKISLSYELFCYSFVSDTHYELDKYAKRHNVRIINATPGSLIDAYERDDNYISNIRNANK
ncbi:MAG: hypothetical protein AAGU76_07915 [Sedimentibacter sp.]|uniref:hypothetical protein n=1 Tax=Sedimentibacter sp. TaxID=1960295 RepID=UPI0031590789